MKKIVIILFVSCMLATLVSAETTVRRTMLQTKQDIDQAVETLTQLRDKHIKEKIKFGKDITALEKKIMPLRKKADQLKALAWQKETGFRQLNEDVDYLKREADFCAAMLNEFRREMGSRMHAPEAQDAAAVLAGLEADFGQSGSAGILGNTGDLLAFVEKHNLENLGGKIFSGKAVDAGGALQNGTFVHLGAVQLFLSQDRQTAGLVGARLESRYPGLTKKIAAGAVGEIIAGKEALIPIDVTAGEAVKIERQKKTWWETVRSGGIVMIPILLLGVFCVLTAIWKFMSLQKLRLDSGGVLADVLALVHKKKIAAARKQALTLGNPLGPVLAEGVEHAQAPREQLEEIMHEKTLGQIPFLEKHLSFLAVAAAVAPLLGLLGTVTGMVHTFDLVAVFGTGKVNILSGGISEALITTEYGLIVAIPTLLIHAFLSRRVKRVIHILEQTTLTFINGVGKKG
ncbi:MotA/TolQ/ExbB proton channel family protein [bacterium]|nr:MotA/TolQ/ExbB proton channel family protein [bacterium]